MKYTKDRPIRNMEHFTQPVFFVGMEWGICAPTDLDVEIDLKNIVWGHGEIKCNNSEVPKGQRILLEHKIENLSELGIHGVAMIIDAEGSDEGIYVAKCTVREACWTENYEEYGRPMWVPISGERNPKEFMDAYMDWSVGPAFRRDLERNAFDPTKYKNGRYGEGNV